MFALVLGWGLFVGGVGLMSLCVVGFGLGGFGGLMVTLDLGGFCF